MPSPLQIRGWRQMTLIATQLIGLLFSALDASIISTALGCAIGFAKLSDIYGRREILCLSWVLFVGFSIGCACAATMVQLIVCRAFQGMGASGLYSLSQIVLFEVGPSDKPSLMGGLIGITLAVSYVLGPVLGAVIASSTQWAVIFWINVPAGVTVIVALCLAWPPEARTQPGGWKAIRKIDFVGNVTVISACALLVFSLQEAGSYTYAWDSPVIVVALGLKCTTRIEPILPLRLFFSRVYASCVICTFCTGYVYLSILIILPERFQIVSGESALYSGIHLLPMLGATSFGAFTAGAASRQRNNTSPTLMAAHTFQLIGIGLMSTLDDAATETKAQYGFQVLLGLGFGLALGAGTIMASVQSQTQDLAVAQGAVAQARVFGGAVGIAVCSIIFNEQVTTELSGMMDPEDMAALHHSPTIAPWLPDDVKLRVRSVYASAFTSDISIMICMASLGLVASMFTYERHPPALSTIQRTKEVVGSDGQSDTELALVAHGR